MGTVSGVPSRRYHGLLVGSMAPPVQREVLLHSLVDAIVIDPETPAERRLDFSSFRFRGGTVHPRGTDLLKRFVKGTSCRWLYRSGEIEVTKTLRLIRGTNAAAVTYRVRPGAGIMRLEVRPLVAMRDAHSLRSKDAAGGYIVEPVGRGARVHHYGRTLELECDAGCFDPHEQWWFGFEYDQERDRGYDHHEDLFSPGVFSLQARPRTEMNLTLLAWVGERPRDSIKAEAEDAARLRSQTAAAIGSIRSDCESGDRLAVARLVAAADDFVVKRGAGQGAGTSIIAGYPWFSDWGRDTAISLPGLLLSTRRFDEARQVLETFAKHRRNGLIPNLFNDRTGEAEYNAVDAPLWFVHAACEYRRASGDRAGFDGALRPACNDIIESFALGTDYGIRMDPADGLITAGDETTQLTWMDAKRDGVVFTPRHGKPVEINALWHHVLLSLAEVIEKDDSQRATALRGMAGKSAASFRARFWNQACGCCHDVLLPGPKGAWQPDPHLRPNQVFAASLRHSPLEPDRRRQVVAFVKANLLTPMGLRTLSPADPGYKPRYRGTMWERDAAYHNGTVWPWLLGPYAEAIMRAGEFSGAARQEALVVLRPLVARLEGPALGQLPEVFDAEDSPESPRRPGGCVAQAWSIAETLRVLLIALTPGGTSPNPR